VKDGIHKWIIKAENDLKTAKDEFSTKNPVTDTICFHCQQCVEKNLKAYLISRNKEFRKTHNIAELLELCIEFDIDFNILKESKIHKLTVYATELRYPEFFYIPSYEEAKEAIEIAERVKSFIIEKMGDD